MIKAVLTTSQSYVTRPHCHHNAWFSHILQVAPVWPLLIYASLVHVSAHPKQNLSRFSRFCRAQQLTDRQTDWSTDRQSITTRHL